MGPLGQKLQIAFLRNQRRAVWEGPHSIPRSPAEAQIADLSSFAFCVAETTIADWPTNAP